MSRRRSIPEVDIHLPTLTTPQYGFFEATERCVDFEGAIRSGKSTAAALKLWRFALTHPGIRLLASRWKDEDLKTIREVWRQVAAFFPPRVHPEWNGADGAWIFPNGSWCYLRSLKASEEDARYSKFRGLTLAVIWLEQPEEIPQDIYTEIKGRLSQKGFPKQILLTPNSVDEDHWIATEFPDDGDRPNHRYICADVWSNRANLGDDTIEGLEQDFPTGHPKRVTMLEGRRGPNVIGQPVYDGAFDLDAHISEAIGYERAYPLLTGWDFGYSHPACVFAQYQEHDDSLVILGAVQGTNLFLEQFAPRVLEVRDRWFPLIVHEWDYCDPNGASPSSHGVKQTAADYLQSLGVAVRPAFNGNDPVVRDSAIQAISGRMLQNRFAMHPRCVEFVRKGTHIERRDSRLMVTAFKTGYVWSDRKTAPQSAPNVRTPQKGTRYDHLMNCIEYVAVGLRLPGRVAPGVLEKAAKRFARRDERLEEARQHAEWQRVRQAQRDDDEPFRWNQAARHQRGGYVSTMRNPYFGRPH